MTTYVPFAPSPTSTFQFTATLDAVQYSVEITWSLSGQRWYVNVYTLQGALVWAQAMVGSPPGYDINLTPSFTTSTMVFRVATGNFEITP